MKAKIVQTFLWIICIKLSAGQVKDTVGFFISKIPGVEKKNELYEVRIINGRVDPICIMHSVYIHLFLDMPQKLAVVGDEKGVEKYSLHFAAQDTLTQLDFENPTYDAEPILPHHEIRFKISIPASVRKKSLMFEYVILPEFCYERFKQAISISAETW